LARNLETKARATDLSEPARRLERAGARFEGSLHQTDTYFVVDTGRLKLREWTHQHPDGRSEAAAELIRYERPDDAGPRLSDYVRTPVDDPSACRDELTARHGIRGVVTKQRLLWIIESTRVHLDSVEGIGDFVELETVLGAEPEDAYRVEHERVLGLLGIDPSAGIAGSYVDLLEG
jgi:adenylate cyclase class IV